MRIFLFIWGRSSFFSYEEAMLSEKPRVETLTTSHRSDNYIFERRVYPPSHIPPVTARITINRQTQPVKSITKTCTRSSGWCLPLPGRSLTDNRRSTERIQAKFHSTINVDRNILRRFLSRCDLFKSWSFPVIFNIIRFL